jgi:hypothetical protein
MQHEVMKPFFFLRRELPQYAASSPSHSACRLSQVFYLRAGGGWSSGKYVGTTCFRAAGSGPAPPAVWVFRRLIWRMESLGRGLILVCRFSFVSSRECIPAAALVYKVGCTCVTLCCSQMGK